MRSSKWKFRALLLKNGDVGMAMYSQRAQRPITFIGKYEDELFEIYGAQTPSMSTRDWLKQDNRFDAYDTGSEVEEITGSVKLDIAMTVIINDIARNSFNWGKFKSLSYRVDMNPLNPMLLIEYIKKNGKFYGKKERVFGNGGKESSQD